MKIFKTLFVIAFFTLYTINAAQSVFYGSVQFPSKVENPPHLTLLFKGSEYALMLDKDSKISKKGTFEIYEEHDCGEFYILITEHIKLPLTPDFEFLETAANYRLFKLTRTSKMKEVVSTATEQLYEKPTVTLEPVEYWIIEELDVKDEHGVCMQRTIPKNSIILLMNPQFIIKLESEEWKSDDIYIKLPKIIFDNDIDEKKLQDMSTKMLFASIDLRCLHKKMTKTTKTCAQNRIISVPDPLNCYIHNHAPV